MTEKDNTQTSKIQRIKVNSGQKTSQNEPRVEEMEEETAEEPETGQENPDSLSGENSENTSREEVIAKEEADDFAARLAEAEEAAKDSYDRFLRISAELDNVKKRHAREMENFRKYANEALIKELLGVVDNLERAILSSSETEAGKGDACILEGVEMTRNEILRVFEKFGVTPLDSVGKPFNPEYHEAAMQEESDEYPENTVIREFQRGYLIHDRLLRPAMVVVSR